MGGRPPGRAVPDRRPLGRLDPRRRNAYRAALAATAAGAICWWAGRTGSPWCDPDSLLQGHAGWHLLTAAALAAWSVAVLEGERA